MKLFFVRRDGNLQGERWRFRKSQARVKKHKEGQSRSQTWEKKHTLGILRWGIAQLIVFASVHCALGSGPSIMYIGCGGTDL